MTATSPHSPGPLPASWARSASAIAETEVPRCRSARSHLTFDDQGSGSSRAMGLRRNMRLRGYGGGSRSGRTPRLVFITAGDIHRGVIDNGIPVTDGRDGAGMEIGYTLMTEQSGPTDLVNYAVAAEQAGFAFEVCSDHYFPWLDAQGHAPNAWTVRGAIAQATERVELMTYVTCPIMRYHPAVVAQQAVGPADAAGADRGGSVGRRVVRVVRPAGRPHDRGRTERRVGHDVGRHAGRKGHQPPDRSVANLLRR